MKKVFSVIVAAMLLASLILTGCSDSRSDRENNYDLLLQMPKDYVGEPDNVGCESLEQFKNLTFSQKDVSGTIASIECIDTAFYITYITVRHDGEDIMISGKAVSRCKIIAVEETFNDYNAKSNTIVEVVQDYYITPTNEEDAIDMFKSFGADFIKDSTGEITGMEIKDGDYALQIKEGVNYTLKIQDDVLPMEPGVKYTGAIISYKSTNTVQYLLPAENTQRYDAFQMSKSVMNIATEIKHSLTN